MKLDAQVFADSRRQRKPRKSRQFALQPFTVTSYACGAGARKRCAHERVTRRSGLRRLHGLDGMPPQATRRVDVRLREQLREKVAEERQRDHEEN